MATATDPKNRRIWSRPKQVLKLQEKQLNGKLILAEKQKITTTTKKETVENEK